MLSYARANEAKIITSVVALIHRIAAHIHRPHPRPSRAIARARASHESTGTFHSNRSIPRAHHHTVRARARRSPSTPARDRGDPKGFRPGSRARARRHPPASRAPRRRPPASRDENARVVPRSHLHDGTLARRVKRRSRQPRARLVSVAPVVAVARWFCFISIVCTPLIDHHHGYAHVSNTKSRIHHHMSDQSRLHTRRTHTPKKTHPL